MGDSAPKVQPPHLIRPGIRLKEPIIKCALSSELFKHPLVKSRELSGNLKVSVKEQTVNSLAGEWTGSSPLPQPLSTIPVAPAREKGWGARTGSLSLLFCILHSALACYTI